MSGGEETFLRRWSRLKRTRRDPPAASDAKTGGGQAAEPAGERAPPRAESRAGERAAGADADRGDPKVVAALPPLDSLGKDSDYSPFMREGVPQALRLAALRKLWASDPALAAPDPLDLHNLDYTHLAEPGQVVATSYRIGKGFADEVDKSIERVEKARLESEKEEKDRPGPAESKSAESEPPPAAIPAEKPARSAPEPPKDSKGRG